MENNKYSRRVNFSQSFFCCCFSTRDCELSKDIVVYFRISESIELSIMSRIPRKTHLYKRQCAMFIISKTQVSPFFREWGENSWCRDHYNTYVSRVTVIFSSSWYFGAMPPFQIVYVSCHPHIIGFSWLWTTLKVCVAHFNFQECVLDSAHLHSISKHKEHANERLLTAWNTHRRVICINYHWRRRGQKYTERVN